MEPSVFGNLSSSYPVQQQQQKVREISRGQKSHSGREEIEQV